MKKAGEKANGNETVPQFSSGDKVRVRIPGRKLLRGVIVIWNGSFESGLSELASGKSQLNPPR